MNSPGAFTAPSYYTSLSSNAALSRLSQPSATQPQRTLLKQRSLDQRIEDAYRRQEKGTGSSFGTGALGCVAAFGTACCELLFTWR